MYQKYNYTCMYFQRGYMYIHMDNEIPKIKGISCRVLNNIPRYYSLKGAAYEYMVTYKDS